MRRAQGESAGRGRPRSRLPRGPPLVPAHPGTAGRTDAARSRGKRRLYIISRRAAPAPASLGLFPAAPAQGGAEAAAGPRGGTPGTRRRPQSGAEPGLGARGRVSSAGMPRRARGGRCGARLRRARRRRGPPAPRRSVRDHPARGAPVTRLT